MRRLALGALPRCLAPGPPATPARLSRHLLTGRRLCTEAVAPEERPPALIVKREGNGLATVSLNHKPVNSLTQAVCEEVKAVTHVLEADPEVRGVVFGSGVPGIFSAGLDLRSMHGRSTDELAAFWTAVQEMWLALYTTQLATVAAISGHAPAGGCLIALACDYRVLVEGKYRIGLNEAQIGLVAPPWLSRMLVDTVGFRRAERMLQLGTLLEPEGALAAGLVDEVVPLHQLPAATAAALEGLVAMNETGRASVKLQLREAAAEALRANQSEDLDVFIRLVSMLKRVVLGSCRAGHLWLEAPSCCRMAGPLGSRSEHGRLRACCPALEPPRGAAKSARFRHVWPERGPLGLSSAALEPLLPKR